MTSVHIPVTVGTQPAISQLRNVRGRVDNLSQSARGLGSNFLRGAVLGGLFGGVIGGVVTQVFAGSNAARALTGSLHRLVNVFLSRVDGPLLNAISFLEQRPGIGYLGALLAGLLLIVPALKVIGAIVAAVGGVIGSIVAPFLLGTGAAVAFVAVLVTLAAALVLFLVGGERVRAFISGALVRAFEALPSPVRTAINAMISLFQLFGRVAGSVTGAAAMFFQVVWNAVVVIFDAIVDSLIMAWGGFRDAVLLIMGAIGRAVLMAWGAVVNGIGTFLNLLTDAFGAVGNVIVSVFRTAFGNISSFVDRIADTVTDTINFIIRAINRIPSIQIGSREIGVGGFTISVPTISLGGSLFNIAEVGRRGPTGGAGSDAAANGNTTINITAPGVYDSQAFGRQLRELLDADPTFRGDVLP